MKEVKMILYCKCAGGDLVVADVSLKISNYLAESGLEYMEVQDFCAQVSLSETWIKELDSSSSLSVIACYPRTIKWLFHSYGISVKDWNITYFNIREQNADDIIDELSKKTELQKGSKTIVDNDDKTTAWFPVIDYDRCTYCGKCMDFCLFGVYQRMPDKSIKVIKPENCKDNCPACARICPHVAIMFPKLREKPINGAEIQETEVDSKNLKLDIKDMLGDDVYTALAARKKRSKKKLLKSQDTDKAEEERAVCAANLLKSEEEQCSCDCIFTTVQEKTLTGH